jgi:signal transduction histidine kinase
VARLEADAAERGVRLSLEASPVVVEGDGGLLEQLVFNLVANAVTYNCVGGFAEVRVGKNGVEGVLRVSNSGPRVPADRIDALTEPFQRLERHNRSGAGVGLSIVRAVTTAHGGRLDLAAREDGGLAIDVVFPLPTADTPASPSQHGQGSRNRPGSPADRRPESSARAPVR